MDKQCINDIQMRMPANSWINCQRWCQHNIYVLSVTLTILPTHTCIFLFRATLRWSQV